MTKKKGGNSSNCQCSSKTCDTLDCNSKTINVFNLGVRKIALEMFKKLNSNVEQNIKFDFISDFLPNLKQKSLNDFIPLLLDVKRLGDRSKIEYVLAYNKIHHSNNDKDKVFLATTDIIEFCLGILRNCPVILEHPSNNTFSVHNPNNPWKEDNKDTKKELFQIFTCSIFFCLHTLKMNLNGSQAYCGPPSTKTLSLLYALMKKTEVCPV